MASPLHQRHPFELNGRLECHRSIFYQVWLLGRMLTPTADLYLKNTIKLTINYNKNYDYNVVYVYIKTVNSK